MIEVLTGTGLAASAGLNAYIPLLMLGLLGRFTDLITLPSDWQWLSNGWALGIVGALFAVEVVADKIPVVDHVNDIIQTAVRPTAGGLAFGAASGAQTLTVSDPGTFSSGHQWIPITAGVVISFVVHAMKSAIRPLVNVSTLGVGAPVVSTIEDAISVVVSFVAILFPCLIVFFLVALVWVFVALFRWLRRKNAETADRREAERRRQRIQWND